MQAKRFLELGDNQANFRLPKCVRSVLLGWFPGSNLLPWLKWSPCLHFWIFFSTFQYRSFVLVCLAFTFDFQKGIQELLLSRARSRSLLPPLLVWCFAAVDNAVSQSCNHSGSHRLEEEHQGRLEEEHQGRLEEEHQGSLLRNLKQNDLRHIYSNTAQEGERLVLRGQLICVITIPRESILLGLKLGLFSAMTRKKTYLIVHALFYLMITMLVLFIIWLYYMVLCYYENSMSFTL